MLETLYFNITAYMPNIENYFFKQFYSTHIIIDKLTQDLLNQFGKEI